MKTQEFEFLPGPVFANVVMADEINRATPKTQAGMLECMAERQVTVDGENYMLHIVFDKENVNADGSFPIRSLSLERE